MKEFIEALNSGKGFAYLTDYENYSELSKDELRDIAKELIYAIEESGLIKSDIQAVYETATENLTESYYNEFEESEENNLQFVDTRKNAILGTGDDCGLDEYDLAENGVANTYQVTANELLEMLEAAQNGFTLESLQSDDNVMSVELSDGKTKREYNFLR
jgi:hypothetical protein